jgi:hypothetical protein
MEWEGGLTRTDVIKSDFRKLNIRREAAHTGNSWVKITCGGEQVNLGNLNEHLKGQSSNFAVMFGPYNKHDD